MLLSSSPTFLTRVNGSSRMCSVPSCEPTDRTLWLEWWNFIEDIPIEPTEYCIVHLWDWSMKSQMSIVPFDFPIKHTPARLGLQQPEVLKDPFPTMLVKSGTFIISHLHQCYSSRCKNGSRKPSGLCSHWKAASQELRLAGSTSHDSRKIQWYHSYSLPHQLI